MDSSGLADNTVGSLQVAESGCSASSGDAYTPINATHASRPAVGHVALPSTVHARSASVGSVCCFLRWSN